MKSRTIARDYDPNGVIDGDCDPGAEFSLWREFTKRNPVEWSGDEFTLADFEEYIERRKTSPE